MNSVPSEFFIKTFEDGFNLIGEFTDLSGLLSDVFLELYIEQGTDIETYFMLTKKIDAPNLNTLAKSDLVKIQFNEDTYLKQSFNNINFEMSEGVEYFAWLYVAGDAQMSGAVYDSFNQINNNERGYNAKIRFLVNE